MERQLLGPQTPARGMRSFPNPATLPPGIWSRLENVRCADGTLRVRFGALNRGGAIIGAELRGLASVTFDGTPLLVAAFRVSGETRLYRRSGSSWTEFSGVGTRFATEGRVGFVVVHDRGCPGVSSASDRLVVGNGADACRVAGGVNLGQIAVHTSVATPAWARQTAVPFGWHAMTSHHRVSASNASRFGITAGSGTTGPQITIDPTLLGGESITIIFDRQVDAAGTVGGSGLPLTKEIALATAGASIWPYVRSVEALVDGTVATAPAVTAATNASPIAITTAVAHGRSTGDWVRVVGVGGNTAANGVAQVTVTSATTLTLNGTTGTGAHTGGGTLTPLEWITVLDASNGADVLTRISLPPSGSGNPGEMAAIAMASFEGRSGWCGLRLTANDNAPATAQIASLICVAGSGRLDGECRFAVGLLNSASRAEGVSIPCDLGNGMPLQGVGGTALGANYRWNPGSDFRTSFRIAVADDGAAAGSPNYGLAYRSAPFLDSDGEIRFGPYALAGAIPLPHSGLGFASAIVSTNDADGSRQAKEVGHRGLPPGRCFATLNDRLWVAGTAVASELWVSADGDPFGFRTAAETDDDGAIVPTSGTYRTFGGERIVALRPTLGDLLGVDALLVWTDRGLYRLGGFDARDLMQAARLNEQGAASDDAVAAWGNAIAFLDSDGDVRRTRGGISSGSLSRGRVEDLLDAADLSNALALAGADSVRIFSREGEDTGNRTALVWSDTAAEWVLDRFPFAIAGAVAHPSGGRRVAFAIESDGTVWELDVPGQTTEGGAAVAISIVGPEVGADGWQPTTFGSIGVVVEPCGEATLTTRRLTPHSGGEVEGVLELPGEPSTLGAWRYDSTADGGIPGTKAAPSCIPSLSGELPGGTRIRAIVLTQRTRSVGPDRG